MWRARGDATFAKSHALENKPMSDMNQESAEISAQTPAVLGLELWAVKLSGTL
jgi:hypothetical protein